MTTADVLLTDYGALLKQNNKRLKLEILSPETLSASVISLDPPPLKLDRRIEGLKRIEIRIPAYIFAKIDGNITVRLMAED